MQKLVRRMEQIGAQANLGLLDEGEARRRQRELSTAVDKVREKYGFGAVTPGAVLRARRRDQD
jgi:hypothetical protein